MAFWVLGGASTSINDDDDEARRFEYGGNMSMNTSSSGRYYMQKRGSRVEPWETTRTRTTTTTTGGLLAFLVIREGETPPSPSPSPEPRLVSQNEAPPGFGHGNGSASAPPRFAMERTQSGLSISSSPHDDLSSLALDDNDDIATGRVLSDLEAAHLVHAHLTAFRRRCPDSQSERILRALISPKSRAADFPLDNDALCSIFSASNELFFASRLACRVAWDWSHPACGQYESHIVGTTALRRCARLGGWETLIVLSSPILRDTKYNRRLLISTFLHEMIHSFMFVTCGLKASHDGGHTQGFRQIAAVIDDWAGKDYLRLTDMEADLERFRGDDTDDDVDDDSFSSPHMHHHHHHQHHHHLHHHHSPSYFPAFVRQEEGADDDNCSRLCPGFNHPESRDWPRAHHDLDRHRHHNHHQHQHHQHHQHHHHHHLHHHLHDAAYSQPGGQGEWQWCEQENFGAHSPYVSGSPYVY
ncbi:hypothetical protein CP532_2259 [Ophiocordyceps camponoti-leonardi (nom. inval.)]|nr:hypothetical protein CP532_2259 [Ophiocordyceps camponoti-leonardi (nom. inval.)]